MKARRARLLAVLLLALAVAGDLIVEGYLDFQRIRHLRAEGRRQNGIASAATEILAIVQGVESAQRGYLLTEREAYLTSPEDGLVGVRKELQGLRELLRKEPEPLARVEVTATLADTKLQEMAETVRLARAGRREAALQLVQGGVGLDLMERLRENLGSFLRASRDHMQQIREELDHLIDRTLRLTMLKGLLVVIMVIAMYLFAMAEIRSLERDGGP